MTRVFSLPLRTRFRGITVREGMVFRGDAGWGEWSPFVEYDDATALTWLRCAHEAALGGKACRIRAVNTRQTKINDHDPFIRRVED